MSLSGQLSIRLDCQDQVVRSAQVVLQRPVVAISQLLVGLSPVALLERIPLLFALCAGAQQVAAVRALEQAVNWQAAPEVELARSRLTELELIRESLVRLVQDWPLPLPLASLKALLQRCQQGINELQPWLGFRVQPMLHDPQPLHRCMTELQARWPEVEACAQGDWLSPHPALSSQHPQQPLPEVLDLLGLTALLPNLRLGQMEAEINGQPRTTGPAAAAQAGVSLGEQLVQRVQALMRRAAQAVAGLNHPPTIACIPGLEAGEGVGRVKTARGCLLQRVQVQGQQVRQWQMIAPTDWNFHPQGVLTRQLSGLVLPTDPAEAEALVRALVLSIDPCVDFVLHWESSHA